ncbi:MAG: class I SAM-dependent methyltransferase [Pseudomonadota bacterium]
MAQTIKTMKLYSAVERIHNDLSALGYGRADALDVDVLAGLDQLHYHGTQAVDAAAAALGIGAGARVLDIGSGFGGPARWLAAKHGAAVTAVELQGDFHDLAADLSARADLGAGQVTQVQGDILATALPAEGFEAAVSWLALYHIPDRGALFPRVHAALKPGGGIYVEDLYEVAPPSAAEARDLAGMMAAGTMQTREAYLAELADAGFGRVDFQDMTADWAAFTAERLAAFRAGKADYVARQGAATFAELEEFYQVIADLLGVGRLGGVRLVAWKD